MNDESQVELITEKLSRIGAGELEIWELAVLSDESLFKEVYSLIFSGDQNIAWRAGWIIDNATEDHPELLLPLIPDIISQLIVTENSSLKRIFTRMLGRYEIPEELLATTIDRCFELLSGFEPVAVRANAMQVLFNISQKEPDLKQELAAVLESLLEEGGSAGLVNRAQKLLGRLSG
jgi:hypothetical protein